MSGGMFEPPPEAVFRPAETPTPIRVHLWRTFLMIAAFLLIIDIVMRRVELPALSLQIRRAR